MTDLAIHKPNDSEVVAGIARADDIVIRNGDVVLIRGADAIAQHIKIRLRTILGEWFLNTDIGFPLFENVLVKNPSDNTVRSLYIDAITSTQGVEELNRLELDFDSATRKLSVEFTATTTDGDVLIFDEEFIISGGV